MKVDAALRLGVDAARAVARGEQYGEELTAGVDALFAADAGACLTRWDATPSGMVGVGLATSGATMSPRQLAAAQAAAHRHPAIGLLLGRSAPTVHRVSQAVRLEEFWETDVWTAMHGHSGSRYPAALVLLRTPATLVFLGVDRQDRDLDDEEMAGLVALGEPLRAALAFREALDRACARLAALSPEPGGGEGADGPFTLREAEVVALVAQGWTDARIARWLGLSESGVRHRLTSARDRVRAANRAELVARWTELHR